MLEGRKRVIDACDGLFIRVDVEISDCVVDELEQLINQSLSYRLQCSNLQFQDLRLATWCWLIWRSEVGCFGLLRQQQPHAPPHVFLGQVTLLLSAHPNHSLKRFLFKSVRLTFRSDQYLFKAEKFIYRFLKNVM